MAAPRSARVGRADAAPNFNRPPVNAAPRSFGGANARSSGT